MSTETVLPPVSHMTSSADCCEMETNFNFQIIFSVFYKPLRRDLRLKPHWIWPLTSSHVSDLFLSESGERLASFFVCGSTDVPKWSSTPLQHWSQSKLPKSLFTCLSLPLLIGPVNAGVLSANITSSECRFFQVSLQIVLLDLVKADINLGIGCVWCHVLFYLLTTWDEPVAGANGGMRARGLSPVLPYVVVLILESLHLSSQTQSPPGRPVRLQTVSSLSTTLSPSTYPSWRLL